MAVGEVLFICLEFIGTVSFAVSGAMAALEKRVDLFGVIFLGITTALAGGILRDVIIGRVPPERFCGQPVYDCGGGDLGGRVPRGASGKGLL